jgi:hypothetical protein
MTIKQPQRAPRVQAKPTPAPTAPLVGLVLWSDYARANAHVFPSEASLRWAIRRYRHVLLEHRALLEIGGRTFIDPVRFEVAIREIGVRAAARGHEIEVA